MISSTRPSSYFVPALLVAVSACAQEVAQSDPIVLIDPPDAEREVVDAADVSAPDAARDASTLPDVREPARGPCPLGPPSMVPYEVGVPVLATGGLVEYVPGDLPIIIGAPHGGRLEPEGFEVDEGSLARDGGSLETARLVVDELERLTGRRPHLVVNHVARNRLNLNRDDARPNAELPVAVEAWEAFHGFVDDAKVWVSASCGRGHYFDFHTNGHEAGWVEVGLGLSRDDLALDDASLDAPEHRDSSFYRHLASRPGADFVELVRGPTSLGGMLESRGVLVVPSPMNPGPGEGGYFSGGYNSQRHGSRDGGVVDATQLEFHFQYINSGATKREEFSRTMADVMRLFVELHYGFELGE